MFRRGARCRLILFLILCLLLGAYSIPANEYDLCIYGATSGGVVAALQADRMGKSVVLLEPFEHVGGDDSHPTYFDSLLNALHVHPNAWIAFTAGMELASESSTV